MWKRYGYFEKRPIIKAKGGIKAQNRTGPFGQKWWAKRWIQALESFHDGARLGRGRSYARGGQVLAIDIQKGKVMGKVQGTRPIPYEVEIRVDVLSQEAWRQIAELLSKKAFYAAKLLAGEMPQDIEEVFQDSNYSLFPKSHQELQTDCSCPDWSNPCKHVAAVFYLLGEEFDRDPFLIFKLRGVSLESFMRLLEDQSPQESPTESTLHTLTLPLTVEPQKFWQGQAISKHFQLDPTTPPQHNGTLAKSLGKFPFWRGNTPLQEILENTYRQASQKAIALLNSSPQEDL